MLLHFRRTLKTHAFFFCGRNAMRTPRTSLSPLSLMSTASIAICAGAAPADLRITALERNKLLITVNCQNVPDRLALVHKGWLRTTWTRLERMKFQHDGKILWSVSQGTNVKDELRDRRSLEEVSAERHLANENAFSGPPV